MLAVHKTFYVDDGLMGANLIPKAISLQTQVQELIERGAFLLKNGDPTSQILCHLPPHLVDQSSLRQLLVQFEHNVSVKYFTKLILEFFKFNMCLINKTVVEHYTHIHTHKIVVVFNFMVLSSMKLKAV